jgi:hypothetical protein
MFARKQLPNIGVERKRYVPWTTSAYGPESTRSDGRTFIMM